MARGEGSRVRGQASSRRCDHSCIESGGRMLETRIVDSAFFLHPSSFLRRSLSARREVSTPFGAREHLVGVAPFFRVEDMSQGTHGVKVVVRELPGHKIDLFHTDPMFARHAASKFNTAVQN